MMSISEPVCLYCERSSDLVPLLSVQYQGQTRWICPQHLPILIHKPEQLADKLPGVEKLAGTEHAHD